MVSENDHSKNSKELESRPPTLDDLLLLCRRLNEEGVKYVVIGGMAMLQQGFVRATEDIDLLVDVSLSNEEKIRKALEFLPDKAVLEIKPGDLDTYEVIRVADEIVVDLMKTACGIDFSQAAAKIALIEIQGTQIPFANIDLLIELKQSIREKDKIDLQFLKHKKSNQK